MPVFAEPETTDNKTPRLSEDSDFADEDNRLDLLELDEKKFAKRVHSLWRSLDKQYDKKFAEWGVNFLRFQGIPGVGLVRRDSSWGVYVRPGVSGPDHVPIINKAKDLVRKFVALVLTDPPAAEDDNNNPSFRSAYSAEMATRILEEIDSERHVNESKTTRRALFTMCLYDSGFVHYYVDPHGGTRAPLSVKASPLAVSIEDALDDPETGLPRPGPYVTRYVTPDGTLTDDRAEAQLTELPAVKREVLSGKNVRLLPHGVEDVWDAEAVIIGRFQPYGRLLEQYPDVFERGEEDGGLTEEKIREMCEFRPPKAERIVGPSVDLDTSYDTPEEHANKLVWTMTAYFRSGSVYREGAVVVLAGKDTLLYRGPWVIERESGETEEMDIPVTQYKGWSSGEDHDSLGEGLMATIGKANEMRHTLARFLIDYIDRLINRKTFLPVGSMITAEELNDPGVRTLPINPGFEPSYERVERPVGDVWNMHGSVTNEMEDASMLSETAQGTATPSVKSGRHALAIVQQAQAALSEIHGNISFGFIRAARIKLQLVKAFFHSPQSFQFVSEDEMFKLEEFQAADLSRTNNIRLKPGTLTMMMPAQKAQLAEHYFALGQIPPDEMERIISTNVGGILGLRSNPARLRIQGQIKEWLDGPPEDWQPWPKIQPVDPFTGQPAIDPTTGQPQPPITVNPFTGQPGEDPAIASIWQPSPSDPTPQVANVRVNALTRLMQTREFLSKPAAWREPVELEYNQMAQVLMTAAQGAAGAAGGQQAAVTAAGSPADQDQANDQSGLHDEKVALTPNETGGA